jgi:acetyl-CoA carboxylase carboxyl transferase subunit alpha
MLEHSIYSVISPEGAASILWRDTTRSKDAATNMKITAQDLLELKIIDRVIPEPLGGAHRGAEAVIKATGEQIAKGFADLSGANMDYREHRREKFLAMGRTL